MTFSIISDDWFAYFAFIITISSAYRLAKFNIQENSKSYFLGLPVPANTILILSLLLIFHTSNYDFIVDAVTNDFLLIALVLISSFLMNSKYKFISLKFTSGSSATFPEIVILSFIISESKFSLVSKTNGTTPFFPTVNQSNATISFYRVLDTSDNAKRQFYGWEYAETTASGEDLGSLVIYVDEFVMYDDVFYHSDYLTAVQAAAIIAQEAKRANSYYVNHRWLGGMLTNSNTFSTRIQRLKFLESQEASGYFEKLTKKESALLKKELEKLRKYLSGVKEMIKRPDIIIVVDQKREMNAIKEALKLKIPIISILDTNCDPDLVDIPIPGNDDALRSIKFIIQKLADQICLGQRNKKFVDVN